METNESGAVPVEFKCIVLPDPVEEKTAGGLYKPDVAKDREKLRTVKANLIAVGGNAFEDWKYPIPKAGDRVYVAVGAGILHKFNDQEYRIVNDKDIAAILTEE